MSNACRRARLPRLIGASLSLACSGMAWASTQAGADRHWLEKVIVTAKAPE